tara:strand:- start:364 stop:675 length:312 start_codon:yes stop_codon:yes gene_type:complete
MEYLMLTNVVQRLQRLQLLRQQQLRQQQLRQQPQLRHQQLQRLLHQPCVIHVGLAAREQGLGHLLLALLTITFGLLPVLQKRLILVPFAKLGGTTMLVMGSGR